MKNSIQANEQDIQIMNSLAIIHSEKGHWKSAKLAFSKAIEIYNSSLYIKDYTILVRICYNLSKTLCELKDLQEALKMAKKGIHLCEENESVYLFGELLYQKGLILIEMDKIEDGIDQLQKASTIFSLFNKENYRKETEERIRMYKK